MNTGSIETPHPIVVEKASELTTIWDQIVLSRIRQRLAAHGLVLELHDENSGGRWTIPGHPLATPHIFGSLHLALYHADAYTAVWYNEPPLAGYMTPS